GARARHSGAGRRRILRDAATRRREGCNSDGDGSPRSGIEPATVGSSTRSAHWNAAAFSRTAPRSRCAAASMTTIISSLLAKGAGVLFSCTEDTASARELQWRVLISATARLERGGKDNQAVERRCLPASGVGGRCELRRIGAAGEACLR